MACIRGLLRHWREDGCGHLHHPEVFHLHLLPDHGFPGHRLSFCGFLDECKEVYPKCEEESFEVSLRIHDFRGMKSEDIKSLSYWVIRSLSHWVNDQRWFRPYQLQFKLRVRPPFSVSVIFPARVPASPAEACSLRRFLPWPVRDVSL